MVQPKDLTLAVALLTFNRFHLCKETYDSIVPWLPKVSSMVVVDGGSSLEEQRMWVLNRPNGVLLDTVGTVGKAQTIAIDLAIDAFKMEHGGHLPDVVVFSADDYVYHQNWVSRLMQFWVAASPQVGLATLNWEPQYPWNTVLRAATVGHQQALFRASVPGSSWSFRGTSWRTLFGPLEDKTGGEDLTVCNQLMAAGFELAALDLSIHAGERESAWGNQSWKRAVPLEFKL